MSLRASADYLFGPKKVKVIPLDADRTTPIPLTGGSLSALKRYGGIGPFDFSGASNTAAVPFTVKIDNGTPETYTIDVATGSGSVDESAVTATELAAAIEAANAGSGFTGVTASVDSRGYVQVAVDSVTTELYLQIYGEAALIGEWGQGYGSQFIVLDTQQSNAVSPTYKDSETITITDSNGKDTSVITDQLRKGWTGVLTDAAMDDDLRAVIEGGVVDSTNNTYTPPNSDSDVKYFAIEVSRTFYSKGDNLEESIDGYILERYYIATGTFGDDPGDRNFLAHVYNLIGTEYKDPVSGTIYSDSMKQEFTVSDWTTFDWDNI